MKARPKMQKSDLDISLQLENADESSLFTELNNMTFNHNKHNNHRAPSEPVFANYSEPNDDTGDTSMVSFDHLPGVNKKSDNFGIGAMNTIDIYLCVEDDKTDNESDDNNANASLSSIQRHNKYMFTNKLTKQFYFAPYNNNNHWNIFEFNEIFASETSFLCDIFSNVIQPLIESFKNGQSGCLALYSPDKTAWNDRLQLFDIVHQMLLQLNIEACDYKISAYEINDDNAYDLLPIKASHSAACKYRTNTKILQFSRSKINRAPLKLALNRSQHSIIVNINKIGIKSVESGLQYLERSHNLFKSSKSAHYVYTIAANNQQQQLRIVQLCSSDPARNQSLLNIKQCIKVLKRNKTNQSRLRKSLAVPYRRHIFTKLFQEYIDGTSLFSFLFYLPPITRHNTKKIPYLNRILSLLQYSCKYMHTSPYKPLTKQYKELQKQSTSSSSQPPTLTNSPIKQTNDSTKVSKEDTSNSNQSGSEDSDLDTVPTPSNLLQISADSTNSNMQVLLHSAHAQLEASHAHTEQLLSHKNETIARLSEQVDATRNEYEKALQTKISEINVLLNSSNQIKHFLSEITNLLQIDIDCNRNLCWNDILVKISQQNNKVNSLESVLGKVSASFNSDIDVYKQQIEHSQQIINDQQQQIHDMNKCHDKELKELNVVLDELTVHNSPRNEVKDTLCKQLEDEQSKVVQLQFQSVVHQQLSSKIQGINNKLQNKFARQRDEFSAEINELQTQMEQLTKDKLENEKLISEYGNISQLYDESSQLLKESNAENEQLKLENGKMKELNTLIETKQQDIEHITTSYNELLQEITPIQSAYKELKVEHDLVSRAYAEIREEYHQFKQTSSQQIETRQTALNKLKVEHDLVSRTYAEMRDEYSIFTQTSSQQIETRQSALNELQSSLEQSESELKSENNVMRFQCVVHRALYASLKRNWNNDTKQFKAYKESMKIKDEKYAKLLIKYKNKKSNNIENMVKEFETDKENLRVPLGNKALKQKNAYQKVQQSVKYHLFEQHAPNDEIKQILKHTSNQKTNSHQLIPMKEKENNDWKIKCQQYTKKIHTLQQQIKAKNEKLYQEKDALLSQIKALKNEICEIELLSQSRTKYIYAETKRDIEQIVKRCSAQVTDVTFELKQAINGNDILQRASTELKVEHDLVSRAYAEIREEYHRFKQEITPIQSAYKGLKVEHDLVTRAYAEIREEYHQFKQTAYNELLQETTSIQSAYTELKAEHELVSTAYVEIREEYHQLQQTSSQQIETIETSQTALHKLKVEHDLVSTTYAEMRDEYSLFKQTSSQQIATRQSALNELQSSLEQSESDLKSEKRTSELNISQLTEENATLLQQCVTSSKLNESLQTEYNELMDQRLKSDDHCQESQLKLQRFEHLLFDRIVIGLCYKKQRENAQTNLTIQQLKMLELNDEIKELRQSREESQTNQTGLMLQWMQANDAINELLMENNKLTEDIEVKKKNKTCNDPTHQQKISALYRKFDLMCLNIEKAQSESLRFVEKATSLRADNVKLKKENRKIAKELKILRLKEASFAESVQSQNESGRNSEEIKLKLNDDCAELNNLQLNVLTVTDTYMDKMDGRLNMCMDKIAKLNICMKSNRKHRNDVKGVMLQMMSFSENVSNKMQSRFDSILTLYEMRCDGLTRNVRLIKYGLDNQQNEEKKVRLNQQNRIEKHLYDLQFNMKITHETFTNKMTENIKYSLDRYKKEQKEIEITICDTFKLTVDKFTESVTSKNARIEQLESLLYTTGAADKNEIIKLRTERDSYFNEKQLMQTEMKLVHSQLDELNESKTVLMTQLEQLMQFQQNTSQIKQKMEEYAQINTRNKQRIQQLELMKITLEKDNNSQADKMQRISAENKIFKMRQINTENKMQSVIANQQKKVNELLQNITVLESEKEAEIKKLTIVQTELTQKIQNDNDSQLEQMHKMNAQNEQQITTINEMQSVIQIQETKVNELIESIATLKEEKEAETNKYKIVQSQLTQKMQKDNNSQFEQMQKMYAEKEQQIKHIDSMQSIIDNQEMQAKELLESVAMLKEEKETQHNEYKIIKSQLALKIQNNSSHLEKIAKMSAGNEQQINTINKMQSIVDNQEIKVKELLENITVLKQEKEAGTNKYKIVQSQSQKIQKNNNSQLEQIGKLSAQNEQQINTINKMEYMIENQEMKENELVESITALKEEKKAEIKKWKREYDEYKITKSQLTQKMQKDNNSQFETMQSIIDNQKMKINELLESRTVLKQEKEAENNKYRTIKSELKQNIQTLTMETKMKENKLKQERKKLLSKLRDLKSEINEIESECSTTSTYIYKKTKYEIRTVINKYDAKMATLHETYVEEMAANNRLQIELNEGINIRNKLEEIIKNQVRKMIVLQEENESLKNEMNECEIKINKLKDCIVSKLNALNDRHNNKIEQHSDEKAAINYKLETLSIVLRNKLNSFTHIMRNKNIEITTLNETITIKNQQIYDVKHEMYEIKDENDVLNQYKSKLFLDIDELNGLLNTSHSKHRVIKQLYEESNKTNKKLKEILLNIRKEKLDLEQEIAFIKHENEQIYRHRNHIKQQTDEIESRLKRYKQKYKTACDECDVLRRKTIVFDQLLRLSDNQINQLNFDKKSSHLREKMLTDEMKKMNVQNTDLLYKSYDMLMVKTNSNNDAALNDEVSANDNHLFMNDRITDLKSECSHYLKILHLNDANNMDLKQETALYTHQILSYWHKIFDKLSSIINIKSYTIEILHKNVSQIVELNKNSKDMNLMKENRTLLNNLSEMTGNLRKLESKHHKEKVELKGLLDREINLAHSQRDCMEKEMNIYREKLQAFYKKYHRKASQKEHEELGMFMENMRHEMSQLTQENVTMATVTNSLREIVRAEQDKTNKFKTKNESMYKDINELCQYMEEISGERFLSEDEENIYNASNVCDMVCAVKEKALSISSSRSSLHLENDQELEDYECCPICEQEFSNSFIRKRKCAICDKDHCSICAPKRQNNNSTEKKAVCHLCFNK